LVKSCNKVALADAIGCGLEKEWDVMKTLERSKKFPLEDISKILANLYSEI
jgi:hypothetical protein